jgi:hypothetical protein
VLTYPLNAAGVAGFNAARGNFFTVGGSGGGQFSLGYLPSRAPIFTGVSDPAKLVVTCALPTTQAECTNGGWRNYSDFKNQGQCVAFVQRGSKP